MGVQATGAVMARVACTLALIALGFAGNSAARPAIGPYSAEYQLPDGSYASMCLPSERHRAPHGDGNHCDTCITATATPFMLANAPALRHERVSRRDQVTASDGSENPRRIVSHHGLSRAPPFDA